MKKNKRSKKSSLLLFFYLKAIAIAVIVVFIGVYHYLSLNAEDSEIHSQLPNADLDPKSEERNAVGYTLLMQAVSDANVDRIKKLIDDGADVNAQATDVYGMSALELAVFNGNESKVAEIVDILLKAGADPSLPDKKDGRTPLHQIVNVTVPGGKEKVVMSLMKHNAPINFQSKHGDTPMHSIVKVPELDLSMFMINNFGPMVDMGIWDPDIKNIKDNMPGGIKGNMGQTVWQLTLLNVVRDPLYKYLDKGNQRFGRNDSAKKDVLGHNGLMLAVMRNDVEFARDQIANKNADVNAQASNKYGNRPLHFACMRSYDAVPFVKLLIENGADLQLTNALGESPSDIINKKLDIINKKIDAINNNKLDTEYFESAKDLESTAKHIKEIKLALESKK